MAEPGLTSAWLSVLFLVVYGACNWITSQRSEVGTWVYDWERAIPFVPWTIVPYMLIDAFFVAAPFVCVDRLELRVLRRRVTLALFVAAAFFLAMPLRFSFAHPHVGGWLGTVFNTFLGMDKPFNQFPSLHVALSVILAAHYGPKLKQWVWLRVVSGAWFLLIVASTLTTYQHHAIDLLGGFVLGLACLYAVTPAPWRVERTRNARVGTYYAIGGGVLGALGLHFGPIGWALLWPATALLLAAAGYFVFGAAIYRKHDGTLPIGSRLVLWPLRLGQWLSLQHYARRSRAWDEVAPNVWLGRTLTAAEAADAVRSGVVAVVDVTSEFAEAWPFRSVRHLGMPVLDLTAPTVGQLHRAARFISENVPRGTVYVHCKAGYSRSGAIAAAYLLHAGLATDADDAVTRLRAARPGLVIRAEATDAIRQFQASLTAGSVTAA